MNGKASKRIRDLALGQVVSSIGVCMMIQANIGLDPWNVLHMGLSNVLGIPIGASSMVVGAGAILLAVMMKERLGISTVISVFIQGSMIDLIRWAGLIPQMQTVWGGIAMMLIGQLVLAVGTYYYMAALLGAGPRDAVMVAVARCTNISVGVCRSSMELFCVLAGWLLGGKVGVGTILSAVTIGPMLQGVFHLYHYDATGIVHDSLGDSWKAIAGWAKELYNKKTAKSADEIKLKPEEAKKAEEVLPSDSF